MEMIMGSQMTGFYCLMLIGDWLLSVRLRGRCGRGGGSEDCSEMADRDQGNGIDKMKSWI